MLKSMVDDEYTEDFVNWVWSNYCIPKCGCECNNHYEEGATEHHILGCFIANYSAEEIFDIISEIKSKSNDGFVWNGSDGWEKP